MANPESDLFRAVRSELNSIFKDGDFAKNIDGYNKVNTQLKGCFSYPMNWAFLSTATW
jgi:hypothetical protein